jgi:hypothetical protein
MLLSNEFLHEVMSICGVAVQVRTQTVQFYCFTVNVLCREVNTRTMTEIKKHGYINSVVEWRCWRRVGLIELQEDCQCQEIIQFYSFKKKARTFWFTEIMWLGQVCVTFQLRYFVLVS